MKYKCTMTHPKFFPQTLEIESNGMYPALCGARNAYSYLFWVPWNEVQTVAIQPVVEEVIEVERPTEVIKKEKLMIYLHTPSWSYRFSFLC